MRINGVQRQIEMAVKSASTWPEHKIREAKQIFLDTATITNNGEIKMTQVEIRLFNEVRAKYHNCIGFDQYGDKSKKLYIENVSDDYSVITLSNGREYFLDKRFNPREEISDFDEIDWFPKEQRGDWDLIKLANYDEFEGWKLIHGS